MLLFPDFECDPFIFALLMSSLEGVNVNRLPIALDLSSFPK